MLFGVQAIKSIATYDVAVERLRQRFHLGLVAPGSRLPAERRLAEELNVARATLREALRVLAAEGYVSIRRGVSGGAIVPDQASLLQTVQRHAGDLASRYRALEFWEVNQVAAAFLAAKRHTPASLKRLRSIAEHLVRFRDAWSCRAAESELCLAVGASSGNSWVASAVYDSLAAAVLPFMECTGSKMAFSRTSVEALIAAIENSNQEEAVRQMSVIALVYGSRLRPKQTKASVAERTRVLIRLGTQAAGSRASD